MKRRYRGVWVDNSYGVVGTVAVHVGIGLLLLANLGMGERSAEPVQTTISARLVADESTVVRDAEPEPVAPVEEEEAGPDPEALAREQEAERQRQVEAEAERQRQAEAEAEQQRQSEAEAERQRQAEAEAERQRQAEAEAERQRQAEAEAEAERQRQAEAAAERKRQEELARQRAEEERRRQEAAERARQAELEAQLRDALQAEEAREGAINAGLLEQYIELIRQDVERQWNRPAGVPDGITCTVAVKQLRGGVVTSVTVVDCEGGPELVRSIERAVLKASPLPSPKEPSLFDPNLKFPFRTGE
ncbi:MAG: cell envelope integrity protein TolA [Pseudomonadota bacterium]